MTQPTENERAELVALRARVAQLEEERTAQIAAAQERAYWLDRWHVDLNALMARPGAAEFRAMLRAVRGVTRAVRRAKRKLLG